MAGSVVKVGMVSCTIDESELVRLVDRLHKGAATSFLRRTADKLDPIYASFDALVPVRTGLFRSSTRRVVEVRPEELISAIETTADNGRIRYARFSRYTAEEMRAKVDDGATAAKDGAAAQRARRGYGAILRKRHGKGAPTPALRGKYVWATLVAGPFRRGNAKLAVELDADLTRLAGRG